MHAISYVHKSEQYVTLTQLSTYVIVISWAQSRDVAMAFIQCTEAQGHLSVHDITSLYPVNNNLLNIL